MIREPAVAGQFYSADPTNLKRTLQSLLRPPANPIAARAVLSPHAGYVYSGSVAGAVFSSVQVPDRFIILGPNHTGFGSPLSLYPSGEWRTPLGLAPIDSELNDRLLQECPALREDWTAHAHEHSLEVQIPFLQTLMPTFQILGHLCRHDQLPGTGRIGTCPGARAGIGSRTCAHHRQLRHEPL